jgi:cytoplasmic iron level regulating protein YaaA (DUF328/UPF0246 family)
MLLIISPSKTQDFSIQSLTSHTQPSLLDCASQLMENLRKLDVDQVAGLLKTSAKLSQSSWQSFQDFQVPFDATNAKQALLAFKGDVFSGIGVEQYSEEDFLFAQKHLRILSGLYGLLKPLDLIQAYRLEMATALETSRGKNLYAFWKELLTDEVNKALGSLPDPVLVNLASQEYFKVLQPDKLNGRIVNVAFKEKKNGSYKTIAIHAKRARGMMVDFVITNRLVKAEDLVSFSEDDYLFSAEHSSSATIVFCRG